MKIQIGKVMMNKTQKYLRPCLRAYGDIFRQKIAQVVSLGWGIGDMILVRNGITYQQELFVVMDTVVAKSFFLRFIEWIRCQAYYTDDYAFDDIEKGRLHMLVLKIPDQFQGAFEKFKLGEYSQMYKPKDLDFLFEDNPSAMKVIIKDHNYKIEFVNYLNELYETHVLPQEFEGELDFKPILKFETFNYDQQNSESRQALYQCNEDCNSPVEGI